MIKKTIICVGFIFLAPISLYSQVKHRKPDYALSPGISIQKEVLYEINTLIGRYENSTGGNAFGGVRFGFESNLKQGINNIIAPKIGLEISGMLICLRITAINYFQNHKNQFTLLPEFGISYMGFVNLTYGYNIFMSKNNFIDIGSHRICLTFNLNRDLIDDTFN